MSYIRVIPRDLFNEANLLKCYGRLYIALENLNGHTAELIGDGLSKGFQVIQNEGDGSLSLGNVFLFVRTQDIPLSRPLNSREDWPLYATLPDDEVISVFNENGMFSTEMLAFLTHA